MKLNRSYKEKADKAVEMMILGDKNTVEAVDQWRSRLSQKEAQFLDRLLVYRIKQSYKIDLQ